MAYLIDTDVLSELRKRPRANPRILSWFESLSTDDVYLSVLTIGEIRCGAERIRRRDPRTAHRLDQWIAAVVSSFASRVLPVDHAVAEEWGRLNALRSFPVVDGLIAATARVHRLTVATRNVRHYGPTGIDLFDPSSE